MRGHKLRGLKFRRQHPLAPYTLDFYCPEARLAVEIDGQSHDNRVEQDRVRDAFLAAQGVSILRIAARDVFEDMDAVLGRIARAAGRPD